MWGGGGVGSLAWGAFPGAFPPSWASNSSCKVALSLRWMPMSSGMEEVPCCWLDWTGKEWLRSLSVFFGDKGWLNTSKSSSESDNSTTSPSLFLLFLSLP